MGFVGTATSAAIGWLKHAAAAGSTLLNDLVSYWPLDEVSGTRADAVGSADLTDNNTVGVSLAGPSGTVGNFLTANTEYLSAADFVIGDSYTISMWLKASGEQSGAYAVFSAYNGWADDNQVVLIGGNTSMAARVGDGGSSTYKDASITEGGGWASIGWFHVLVTFNAATKVVTIYKNNVLGEAADPLAGTPYRTAAPLQIGRLAVTGQQWNGQMGRIGLWSRVVTEGERASIFNSGVGKSYADLTAAEKVGLVSYWNLDEESDGSAPVTRVDSHGSNDLTDNNTTASATAVAGAMHNAAASFVAANSESLGIAAASAGDLSLAGVDFTVGFWVKTSDTNGDTPVILASWSYGGDYNWGIALDGSSQPFFRYNGAAWPGITATWGAAINDGNWHLVLCWVDETANKTYISVDNGTAVEASITGSAVAAQVAFGIGGFVYDGGNSAAYLFDGLIDEVAIWSRVLTEAEREELYNLGAGKYYPFT